MAGRLAVPSDPSTLAVLERQVQVMFVLADDVLEGLTLNECLWTVTAGSWTVHERDGSWFGELGEETPDMGVPSLAWTMWHPVWWMRTLLAHCRSQPVPSPESVEWPGPERALPALRRLWEDWMSFVGSLDAADLESGSLTRFPYDDDRPFIHVAGWACMELTKNLSEMCLQRRIQADLRHDLP